MKKIISLFSLMFILVSGLLLSISVQAATVTDGTYGENLTWTLDDAGTLTISGTGVMEDLSNTERPYYNYRDSVKKIIIKKGITCIGKYAFCNFKNLTEVNIPSSVLEIKNNAFYNCPSYSPATIPESIEIIGSEAFADCNLKEIYIPKTVKEIGVNAFSLTDLVDDEIYYKTTFSSIVVSDDNPYFSSIDGVLFNKNKSLLICYPCRKSGESYTIPSTVESIGVSAFKRADNLKNIYIPNNVKSIENNAFRLCSNLYEVVISDSVESIGVSAFYYCINLKNVTLPCNLMSISEKCFYSCKSLIALDIPSKVTTINSRAFYDCELLETITLHNSVSQIGSEAFYDCDNLKNVNFVGSETEWNNISKTNSWIMLNERGTQLHFIIYTTGVELNKTFVALMTNETEMLIATVTPTDATNSNIIWTSSDTNVATVKNGIITSVGRGIAKITATTVDGEYTAECVVASFDFEDDFVNYGFDENGVAWGISGNGIFEMIGNGNTEDYARTSDIPWYADRLNIIHIIVSDGITGIGDRSFYGCVNVQKVEISPTVESIGTYAFRNCNEMTIYGENGTYAETFANDNEIPFVNTKKVELKNITVDFAQTSTRWYFDIGVDDYSEKAVVYIAIYDSQGKMLLIDSAELIIDDITSFMFTQNSQADYAKIFVWKDATLQPIACTSTVDLN